MRILIPLPHCFYYCNFVVSFEIGKCESYVLVVLFQDFLAVLVTFSNYYCKECIHWCYFQWNLYSLMHIHLVFGQIFPWMPGAFPSLQFVSVSGPSFGINNACTVPRDQIKEKLRIFSSLFWVCLLPGYACCFHYTWLLLSTLISQRQTQFFFHRQSIISLECCLLL